MVMIVLRSPRSTDVEVLLGVDTYLDFPVAVALDNLGKRLGESVDIGSGRGRRHAHDLRPMRPQQRVEIEIAGIVHEHRIAGFDKKAAHEIDRLRA